MTRGVLLPLLNENGVRTSPSRLVGVGAADAILLLLLCVVLFACEWLEGGVNKRSL